MSFRCSHSGCDRTFKTSRGRSQHIAAVHRQFTPQSDAPEDPTTNFETFYHPFLNAVKCDANGTKIPDFLPPPPFKPLDGTDENPFHPFEDRLAFEWCDYQFTELQNSEPKINRGLDLWLAALRKHGEGNVPWKNAQEMYETIDTIQAGQNPFRTIQVGYTGPLPDKPPKWMIQKYELTFRDSRLLMREQIASPEFNGHFNYAPYMQFNGSGHRVWSNLMSGDWAWKQADEIAEDEATHGAMLVPIVCGSDKTTVSVATGHQEFHPVYQGAGNVDNTGRRAHGFGMAPVAILPIPKASKKQRKRRIFQRFCRQLYHACLARIFSPFKAAMTVPEVVRCPDGHFRRAIYSLGPFIADYPEQVWLSGIVQNWCPKCDAPPEHLDEPDALPRSHEMTDFLIQCFDPGTLWDDHGLRDDVVPFTHGFPRADIHELLSPDILHQLIKGTFKDHLIEWVQEYLYAKHGEARALEIIQDIDRRISAVPAFPGLRRFPDGRDFNQWTGDDSKALMKVYIGAIEGYVPPKMVQCLSAFMDCCYIIRRNAITAPDIAHLRNRIEDFQQLRDIFIEEGVRVSISLPRQHGLPHYPHGIEQFGSPNGLCSSITESKHIKAIKEPWRRSSRYKPVPQMVRTITRLEQLSALRQVLRKRGLLDGQVSDFMAACRDGEEPTPVDEDSDDEDTEVFALSGPRTLSGIRLAVKPERLYSPNIDLLADEIAQPEFPLLLRKFIFSLCHPTRPLPADIDLPSPSRIRVFHSALAHFYAPSDLCGAGGMHRERIRANPHWGGYGRHDTVLVNIDNSKPGMEGMLVARVLLFFSFPDPYLRRDISCALVNWFILRNDRPDENTGMWVVEPEMQHNGTRTVEVIELETIFRATHLLPRYGYGALPEDYDYRDALDDFSSYYVNHFVDHHIHEVLT